VRGSILANGSYLLDTNVVIALMRGDVAARDLISRAEAVYLPIPVVGELYYGAFRSAQVDKNIQQIDQLIETYTLLRVDEQAAKVYGRLRQELATAGRPIPDNDLWIASIAQRFGLTVVTRDAHFDAIGSLNAVRW
jgi:tRNA(fMet)-specific endonuclease VapC